MALRFLSRHAEVYVELDLDSQHTFYRHRDSTKGLMDTYGCTGLGKVIALVIYDTVNGKYMMELVTLQDFGNSLKVELINLTGADQRCYVDVNWIENM